ncbi:ADP-ribosylglycohydrolase family protein [Saccharopolyspora sp. NPDC002686]|uniref:ADP-ribosylglycohydrolase family protein n=1 Tax=Saccharopolyspora sp. NPDC002686 TaxID=3154541 RepID=UPI003318E388
MSTASNPAVSRDERLVLDRLRDAPRSDEVWRAGKRRNDWDVALIRRAFGRSSDEFCRGQSGQQPELDDIALIHGMRANFGAAVRGAVVADQVLRGGSGLSAAAQMMLFGLDSVVRAETYYRVEHAVNPGNTALFGLLRWRHTQGTPWSEVVPGAYVDVLPEPTGWLIKDARLFQQRDPDPVCDAALAVFAERQVFGSFRRPINDARTPSAILRTIGMAAWSDSPEEVLAQAAANALLTHGHPDAYLSAGAFAVIINTLLAGGDLAAASEIVLEELVKWPGCGGVHGMISSAGRLGRAGDPSLLRELVGAGNAPNALAVAIAAAHLRFTDFDGAVRLAGELLPASAVLVGAMLGAGRGDSAVPPQWSEDLVLRDVFDRLTADVLASRGVDVERRWQQSWVHDYPSF